MNFTFNKYPLVSRISFSAARTIKTKRLSNVGRDAISNRARFIGKSLLDLRNDRVYISLPLLIPIQVEPNLSSKCCLVHKLKFHSIRNTIVTTIIPKHSRSIDLVVKVVARYKHGWMVVEVLLSAEKDFKIEARSWETKSRLAWTLYIMNARNWSTKSFDARWCSRSRNLNTKRRGKSALAARWRQPFTIVSIVTVTRHNRSWTTTKRSNNGFQVGRLIVTSQPISPPSVREKYRSK